MLKLKEEALLPLRSSPQSSRRRPKRNQTAPPAARAQMPVVDQSSLARDMESYALQLMLRSPEALYTLDRVLQKEELSRFTPQDFEQAQHQTFARLIQNALEEDSMEPGDFIDANLPDSLSDLAAELGSRIEQQGTLIPEKLLEELIMTILRLRKLRVQEGLQQLQYLQLDQQIEENDQPLSYQNLVFQYSRTLARLNRALGQPLQLD
jgi:DNA primase